MVLSSVTSSFAIERDWRDSEPGIEVVELRYVCSRLGQAPDWTVGEDSRVLTPRGTGELLDRSCAIELPCGYGDDESFALHYYHLVIQHGHQHTLDPTVEEIVSRTVTFCDAEGCCAAVGLHWTVGNSGIANYTLMAAKEPSQLAAVAGEKRRASRLQSALPPKLFNGRVWGPRGATVRHVFHLLKPAEESGNPNAETWDVNGGAGWQLTL